MQSRLPNYERSSSTGAGSDPAAWKKPTGRLREERSLPLARTLPADARTPFVLKLSPLPPTSRLLYLSSNQRRSSLIFHCTCRYFQLFHQTRHKNSGSGEDGG